jgi:protein involved in polysaccharide export with SLBB domain
MFTRIMTYGWGILLIITLILSPWRESARAQTLDGNDEIDIMLPDYAELTGTYILDTNGRLHLKISAPISLDGLSVRQAEIALSDSLAQYIHSVAGLKITAVREFNLITITGFINVPGSYRIPDQANLPELLVAAGGYNKGALLNRIEVRHYQSVAPPLIVNYARFLYRGDQQDLPVLRAGDVVFIPKGLGEVNSSEGLVYIFGAVRSPGIYEVSSNTTLLDALSFSGGPSATADIRKLKIIPAAADRSVQTYNLTNLEKRTTRVVFLQPGDIVMVPEKGKNYLSVSIQIISALALLLNAYQFIQK